MSQTKDSAISLLSVIVLLVLTAMATVLYGSNAEQKAQLNNSIFWQKTRSVFDIALVGLESITAISLSKKTSPLSSTVDINEKSSYVLDQVGVVGGFWPKTAMKIKNAWEKSSENSSTVPADSSLDDLVEWRQTDSGAEIIFRPKSEIEHKLVLPFKSLSR
ncbi:MAG: hypothetical protein WC249_03255 [Patescibacteria group bacterium]|jgi:hypothetical protein